MLPTNCAFILPSQFATPLKFKFTPVPTVSDAFVFCNNKLVTLVPAPLDAIVATLVKPLEALPICSLYAGLVVPIPTFSFYQ